MRVGSGDARGSSNGSNTPKRDLVVVRYGESHNPLHEWVYNRADIDSSEVAWAREMSPKSNRKLLDYFDDRRVWLLEADASPPRLVAHPKRKDDREHRHRVQAQGGSLAADNGQIQK